MSATETSLIAAWLYATLHGDATLLGYAAGGVHQDRDPADVATYPKVIYRRQGGVYVQTVNGVIVTLRGVYAVYGLWRQPSYGGTLESIAARARTLLHRQRATVSGGYIVESVATEPVQFSVIENGVETRALGDLYRIAAQAT